MGAGVFGLFCLLAIFASAAFAEKSDVFELMENGLEIKEEAEDIEEACKNLKCGAGRECVVDAETSNASCQCVQDCGHEVDPRRKGDFQVCSNHNTTFATDCDLHRARCLCEENDPACQGPEAKHLHIEYYGECRNIPSCNGEELTDFPRRMREWLFNVMQELADRNELSEHYANMEKEAKTDLRRRWRNAAVWKWCDLDLHPSDNKVSRHELFPVRAPLQALEHCIGDFLDTCDSNSDHEITLKEWGKCLEIDEEDLIAECDRIDN